MRGIDPRARFLSYISQPGRPWLYLLTCTAIAATVYGGVLQAIESHQSSNTRPPRAMASTNSADRQRDRTMPTKRVFISFDFDHDEELRDALIAQAKNPGSPFEIVDYSVREPFESKWRDKVRSRIRKTDLTIVICGEHTHTAT